jgi:hypothetical protein
MPCHITKEYAAVRTIIRHLMAAGFAPIAAGGEPATTLADVMAMVQNLDECRVRLRRDGATSGVFFVMGNGVPSEVAADWTVGDPVFAAAMDSAVDRLG